MTDGRMVENAGVTLLLFRLRFGPFSMTLSVKMLSMAENRGQSKDFNWKIRKILPSISIRPKC